MTEVELRRHIFEMVGQEVDRVQPPFADVAIPLHPDSPIDYEAVRSEQYEAHLGKSDYIYHPSVGAPHIDVERFPPNADRPFWVYLTNGMSDFPQILPDGELFRSELMLCSTNENVWFAELLKLLGEFPFDRGTFLYYNHTIPLPSPRPDSVRAFGAIIPPFLFERFAEVMLGKDAVAILSVISVAEDEVAFAKDNSTRELIESLPDQMETWLIVGRPE